MGLYTDSRFVTVDRIILYPSSLGANIKLRCMKASSVRPDNVLIVTIMIVGSFGEILFVHCLFFMFQHSSEDI